jgi:hypothetical protein
VAVPEMRDCDEKELSELIEFTGCEQPVLYFNQTEFTS